MCLNVWSGHREHEENQQMEMKMTRVESVDDEDFKAQRAQTETSGREEKEMK